MSQIARLNCRADLWVYFGLIDRSNCSAVLLKRTMTGLSLHR